MVENTAPHPGPSEQFDVQEPDVRRVGIACQGGGAHTAFTAGVLTRLLTEHREKRIDIRALSGTSGGAACAVLAWSELVDAARELDPGAFNRRIEAFWEDNTLAPLLVPVSRMALATARIAGGFGLTLETSAHHIPLDGHRMFRELIEKRVPFARLTPDHLTAEDPRLLISAADVLTGEFRVFRSHEVNGFAADLIDSHVVLASAALPTVFTEVTLSTGTYWDGGFTQNPPTRELVDACRRDSDESPPKLLELWFIQVNPQRRKNAPTAMDDIRDRRNELLENISYQQEVHFIWTVNKFLARDSGLLTDAARAKYGLVKLRALTMSDTLAEHLDYESKSDRDPAFIHRLFRHGVSRAEEFLGRLGTPAADTTTTLPDRNIWGKWIREYRTYP